MKSLLYTRYLRIPDPKNGLRLRLFSNLCMPVYQPIQFEIFVVISKRIDQLLGYLENPFNYYSTNLVLYVIQPLPSEDPWKKRIVKSWKAVKKYPISSGTACFHSRYTDGQLEQRQRNCRWLGSQLGYKPGEWKPNRNSTGDRISIENRWTPVDQKIGKNLTLRQKRIFLQQEKRNSSCHKVFIFLL